jgi:hypothetical protein
LNLLRRLRARFWSPFSGWPVILAAPVTVIEDPRPPTPSFVALAI